MRRAGSPPPFARRSLSQRLEPHHDCYFLVVFLAAAWRAFPAGTSFEVPGQSGFDVKAAAACAYLCEYL